MLQKKVKNHTIELSTILFGLYTAILPISSILLFGNSTINFFLAILIVCVILLSKFIRNERVIYKPVYAPLAIFVFISLISQFWSIDQNYSFQRTTSFLSLVLFFSVLISKSFSFNEKIFLRICSVLGGLITALYLISVKELFVFRVLIQFSDRNADPNGVSAALAVSTVFLVYQLFQEKNKMIILLIFSLMIIMVYGMFLTGSRGGLVALIIGVLTNLFLEIWYKRKTKRNIFLFISTLLVSWFVFIRFGIYEIIISKMIIERLKLSSIIATNASNRFWIWDNAIQSFLDKPVFGYGFGTAPNAIQQISGRFSGSHNDILYILLGTGVIGLIFFIIFLLITLRKSIIKKDILALSLLATLLIISLNLDYLLNKNFWNILIFAQIGIGVIKTNEIKVDNLNHNSNLLKVKNELVSKDNK